MDLLQTQKCIESVKKDGKALVAVRESSSLPKRNDVSVHALPAEAIAMEVIGKPYANTVLLGAFAKVTGAVELESILKAVEDRFKEKKDLLEKNLAAVKRGYENV